MAFPGVLVDVTDAEGLAPVHYACMTQDSRLLYLFLSENYRLNMNIYSRQGRAPIHLAMRYASVPMVKRLLECPEVSVNITDNDGKTPLILAAEMRRTDLYDPILSDPEVDVNIQSHTERTAAIHIAVENDDTELFEKLVHHEGIQFDLRTNIGKSPLHYAAAKGNLDMVKFLAVNGRCDVNAATNSGLTPIHYAAESRHIDVVNYLLTVDGIDPAKRDVSGLLPRGLVKRGSQWEYIPDVRFIRSV